MRLDSEPNSAWSKKTLVRTTQLIGLINFWTGISELVTVPNPKGRPCTESLPAMLSLVFAALSLAISSGVCSPHPGPLLVLLVCAGVIEKPLTCRFTLAATKACTAGTF